MKRLVDCLLILLTAPLWGTVLAATALIIRVCDGAPIFFRQERAGRGGRPFTILKFRTMRQGEGTDLARTTKLGKFLRATSLDELPQLLNVLKGDMALVGPRPLPTAYVPRYSKTQARRLEVRPGLTGWAQVNGRNALSWDEKFALDVWYVENQSLWLDIRILFKTFAAVFTSRGINATASETMPEFTGSSSLQN